MSEHKHTPGPWHIDKECEGIFNGKCLYVCDIPVSSENAQLIKAAPDMLEALTEADKTLCALQANIADAQKREPRWDGVWDEIETQRVAIKAAIAKANGASHE